MNYLISIIIISFTFCAYYDIGDTVSYAHQNELFNICYGDYPFENLKLFDFNNNVSIFGLSTSWWPTTCTFSLEGLINTFENDDRVKIIESLDDPNMPYTCPQWGNIGQENIPIIIETNGQLYNWFSIENYYGVIIILDHNMVFRYYGSSSNQVINIVNQILTEISLIGDVNSDNIINIQDVIFVINTILNNEYISNGDINNDGSIDILDIIQLVYIILN